MEGRSLKPMKFTGNLSENWRQWKQKFDIYATVLELDSKPEQAQCAHLLFQMGEDAIDVFNTFTFADDDKNKIEKLMEKFDNYFIPKRNVTYERYKFFTARQINETIEDFVSSLKSQAQECDFPDNVFKTELIKTMLIVGVKDDRLREHLLSHECTLEKAIDVCNLAQYSKQQHLPNELNRGDQIESDDDNGNLEKYKNKLHEKELNIKKYDLGENKMEFKNCGNIANRPSSRVVQEIPIYQGEMKQTKPQPQPQQNQFQADVPRNPQKIRVIDMARAEATFRFSVPQLSELKGSVISPSHYVRNLPWKIEVGKSKGGKTLQVFLHCNVGSKCTSWSCYASAEIRLVPVRINSKIISENSQRLFSFKDPSWGFLQFIHWDEVTDKSKGYIQNNTITIEVFLRANAPRGLP